MLDDGESARLADASDDMMRMAKDVHFTTRFNFCPKCGARIEWPESSAPGDPIAETSRTFRVSIEDKRVDVHAISEDDAVSCALRKIKSGEIDLFMVAWETSEHE